MLTQNKPILPYKGGKVKSTYLHTLLGNTRMFRDFFTVTPNLQTHAQIHKLANKQTKANATNKQTNVTNKQTKKKRNKKKTMHSP